MVFSEKLDIYSVLLFVSIGQMLANMMFLSFKKNSKQNKSTWFFVFALLVLGLNIVEPVLIRTRLLSTVPHLLYIGPSLLLLLGPMVYFQMLALKNPRFRWKPIYLLHNLPFLLITIKSLPAFLQSATEKYEILNRFYALDNTNELLNINDSLLGLAIQSHPIVYMLVALIMTIKELKKQESRLTTFHVIYLLGFLLSFVFYLFGRSILDFFGLYSSNLFEIISSLLICGFVSLVSFMILTARLEPMHVKRKPEPGKNGAEAYTNLIQYIKEQRPYLAMNISLNSMAQTLSMTPHFLSQIIREFEGRNFSEFINQYRIETVKRLIIDPSMNHYTLEAIGNEAGFANKMSFNRAFKKHCGMTPSEYKSLSKKQ